MNIFDYTGWLQISQWNLLIPLLLAAVMAAGDIRTRRIPNYLTLGGALAGLVFQTVVYGWPGLLQGLGGLAVGFGLMLPFLYLGWHGGRRCQGPGRFGGLADSLDLPVSLFRHGFGRRYRRSGISPLARDSVAVPAPGLDLCVESGDDFRPECVLDVGIISGSLLVWHALRCGHRSGYGGPGGFRPRSLIGLI
jgi:prepilin signal peptidase PulO-like enzyme (type II secretory pathway)